MASPAAEDHAGAAEALRFVLLCFNGDTRPDVTYTLDGAAGPALVHQMIGLLRILADRDTPPGEDPGEFIRRFLLRPDRAPHARRAGGASRHARPRPAA